MPESITAPITFIGGERKDTQTGKERYLVHSNDGREFSCWAPDVFEGVMAHLHETVTAKVYSRQDDRGRWWNTLDGLPDLGLAAPRKGQGSGQTRQSPGAAPGGAADLSALAGPLDRIAIALENLVMLHAEGSSPDADDVPPPGGPFDVLDDEALS